MLSRALLGSSVGLLFFFFPLSFQDGVLPGSLFLCTVIICHTTVNRDWLYTEILTTLNTSPSLVESPTPLNFHCREGDWKDGACSAVHSVTTCTCKRPHLAFDETQHLRLLFLCRCSRSCYI